MTIRDLGIEIGVEIDESPFADVNREIDEITQAIRNIDIAIFDDLERDARTLTGDFEDFNGSIFGVDSSLQNINSRSLEEVSVKSGIASKAMDVLKLGALAAGAAIGGIALSVGTFAMEADAAFGKLTAQTGATGAELVALESTAKGVFADGYGENLEEVTDALSRVKQNIHGLNEASLGAVTSDAMLLANVFDSDVNEVARGVNNTMEAFGVTADKAFDLFTAGGQRGLNFSNEMFDNVAEYAPLFGKMGYTAEEYFGILERGSKAGVYNLDYVNDVMKEFQIRIKDGSKSTDEAMSVMSKSTFDLWQEMNRGEATISEVAGAVVSELKGMEDQVTAGQLAVSLFGTKFEDLESEAVYAMLGTTETMKGFEGATDAAADAVEGTFKNRMVGAWRELQVGIAEVVDNPTAHVFFDTLATKAEQLVPFVISSSEALFEFGVEVMESFDGAGQSVATFIEQYDWLILGIAGGLATYYAISGAMAVYNAAVMFAAGAGPIYTAVTTGMTVATTALGTAVAFLLSPIGLIVIGIGAAIAVGVLLYKNWDTVKEKAGELKDWLGEKFSTIKSSITGSLQPVVSLFDNLMEKWDSFKERVSNFSISGAVKKVAGFIPGFSSGIGRVPQDMVAEIHKDEAIIPADQAQSLRDMGIIDGDGRYPEINFDNLSNTGGTYQTMHSATSSTTSVQAPVNIIVQGGNTNEETGQSVRDVIEEFFADLGAVMPQVREG